MQINRHQTGPRGNDGVTFSVSVGSRWRIFFALLLEFLGRSDVTDSRLGSIQRILIHFAKSTKKEEKPSANESRRGTMAAQECYNR